MRASYFSLLILTIFTFSSVSYGINPFTKSNNSWIQLNGTVKGVSVDKFLLEFDEGIITVEMDDGDRDADGYQLAKGDKVSVSGMVDADLFEMRTIEASSVYVESLGITFYASSLDDEDVVSGLYPFYSFPWDISRVSLTGKVSSVEGRKMVLNTGDKKVIVNTSEMNINPLDDEGYLQVSKGDSVTVYGSMTKKFFEGRELEADSVFKYYDKSNKREKRNK